MGPRGVARGALVALGLTGCQLVAGFEDFEVNPAGTGGTTSTQEPCLAGEHRCSVQVMQRCRVDGTGYDAIETCASEALCNTGKSGGKCTAPACGKGSLNPATGGEFPKNRCSGGKAETCSEDQQQYLATECAPGHCNPGNGQCIELKIDDHEVTVDEYAAFIGGPAVGSLPAVCEGNERKPAEACMADSSVCKSGCGSVPQVCVDWCDAFEYCKSKGQRLCGLMGSGEQMVPMVGLADAGQSEWMNACSAGGEHAWVIGNDWDDLQQGQLCNGNVKARNPGTGDVFPAGELKKCSSPVSAYKNVYDLAGNVAEWENSCERAAESSEASKEDNCRVRGGSYESTKPKLRCDADRMEKRGEARPDVGFRCCG